MPLSPAQIAKQELIDRVLTSYLRNNKSYPLIAREENVSFTRVKAIIDTYLNDFKTEALNAYSTAKMAHVWQLRKLLEPLISGIASGNTNSIGCANNILKEIAKIMGHYAPQEIKLDVKAELTIEERYNKIIEILGLNAFDQIPELPFDENAIAADIVVPPALPSPDPVTPERMDRFKRESMQSALPEGVGIAPPKNYVSIKDRKKVTP